MTTYLNTFTGSTIAPSNATFNTVTFNASVTNIQLLWNLNGYDTTINSSYFAASYIDVVTPTTNPIVTFTLLLPPATQVSPGEDITLINTGTQPVIVKAYNELGQAPITTIPAQQSSTLVLKDNTTDAGVWIVAEAASAQGLATINGLAGRGLTTRVDISGTTVFDSVWPRTVGTGGTVTLYPEGQAATVLTFATQSTITLANQVSNVDTTEIPFGTYYFIKNTSNARLTVEASVLDGDTNGYAYINPNSFAIFAYAGNSEWISMSGVATIGSGANSSTNLGLNSTRIDCQNGPGAVGNIYTLTNQDFGSVMAFYNVQNNQEVILPARVAIYVVKNEGIDAAQNIKFIGSGTLPNPSYVTITGTETAVLATDGAGNVYPGFSTIPGGQYINAIEGTVALPGIFFDTDPSTGMYSGAAGTSGMINTTVLGQDAITLNGTINSLNWTLGTILRNVLALINGDLEITGKLTVKGGIDGGVI